MNWIEAVTALGGDRDVAEDGLAELEDRYGEIHRRYHNLEHATAVARDSAWLADELNLSADERAIVAAAAWAHDVVYFARPVEDERRSADWAREVLMRAGVAEPHVSRVEALVLTTTKHDAPAEDLLATALLDADLATLGADEETYDTYARNVREEFAKYPDELWAPGRAEVLERLLKRSPLYRCEAARSRWEAAARRNLTEELTRWRVSGDDLG